MGLSQDFISYGIHSICPTNRVTGLPYGILKVVGGGTISLSAEFVDLFGGSNRYSWASEPSTISAEFSSTVKSLPGFLFQLFLGATVNETAASATGTVSGLANIKGTSAFDATTGVASVAVKTGSEADLKMGGYIGIATSTTEVVIYAKTDIEFGLGNEITYISDALDITAALTIPSTGGTVDIPNLGVEITGGSGTVAMVVGDSFEFEVAGAHGGIEEIIVGKASAIIPEHSQTCLAAKTADGSMLEIELHRVVGQGMPLPLTESEFSIPELTTKVLYDSCKDRIATFRKVKGVSTCA